MLKQHKAREQRRNQLEAEMESVRLPEEKRVEMRKILRQKETNYLRLRRAKMNVSMFERICTLGIFLIKSKSSKLNPWLILYSNLIRTRRLW